MLMPTVLAADTILVLDLSLNFAANQICQEAVAPFLPNLNTTMIVKKGLWTSIMRKVQH